MGGRGAAVHWHCAPLVGANDQTVIVAPSTEFTAGRSTNPATVSSSHEGNLPNAASRTSLPRAPFPSQPRPPRCCASQSSSPPRSSFSSECRMCRNHGINAVIAIQQSVTGRQPRCKRSKRYKLALAPHVSIGTTRSMLIAYSMRFQAASAPATLHGGCCRGGTVAFMIDGKSHRNLSKPSHVRTTRE